MLTVYVPERFIVLYSFKLKYNAYYTLFISESKELSEIKKDFNGLYFRLGYKK